MKPEHIEIAEQIARDASCAQGEFGQRVLSIIPYLTEVCDRAALPPLRAREEIPEDVVLAFMRRSNLPSRAILEMTVTEWKDGIDIQRPSHSTMEFARALFTAGQEWREPEGWQLVPKELTEDMAAEIECSDGTDEGWQRALAACPPLPPVAEPIVAEQQTVK